MKRALLLVLAALVVIGCEPTPQSDASSASVTAAPPATTVAADDIDTCEQNGGYFDRVEASGPGGTSVSRASCIMPATEKDRQANAREYAFRKSCEDAGGVIDFDRSASGGEPQAFCVPQDVYRLPTCSTSAECEGTCMADTAYAAGGQCGPKRPIAGCFTEAGTNPPKKICAE